MRSETFFPTHSLRAEDDCDRAGSIIPVAAHEIVAQRLEGAAGRLLESGCVAGRCRARHADNPYTVVETGNVKSGAIITRHTVIRVNLPGHS